MSLRAVDARFLLPSLPGTAAVKGLPDQFREGLADAGIGATELGDGTRADVVAVPADGRLVQEAVDSGTDQIIVAGSGAGQLAVRPGFHVTRYALVPDSWHPEFLLPLDQPPTVRYFLDHVRISPRLLEWQAKRLATRLLPAGALLMGGGWGEMAVASRLAGPPAVCTAAGRRLDHRITGWLLGLGPPHAEGRVVFSLFQEGATAPSAVVKLRRLPGRGSPPAGAAGWPPVVAARAPVGLGTVEAGRGYTAELESAACGTVMKDFLRGPFRAAAKHRRVDRVASWAVELARATRGDTTPDGFPAGVALERSTRFGLQMTAGAGYDWPLPAIPSVFEHGDLWTRNVVLAPGSDEFSVLDWDDADPAGVPLRDLVNFLADAYADIEGADTQVERDEHFVRLFSGTGSCSARAFSWIERALDAVAVPAGSAGPLIAVGLADLAQKRIHERAAVPREITDTFEPGGVEPVVRRAELWMRAPGLGPSWPAWQSRIAPGQTAG